MVWWVMGVDPSGRFRGSRARIGHAVGDPDPAETAAGHVQSRRPLELAFERLEPREVADFVLRARLDEAVHARHQGLARDAEQRAERRERQGDELAILAFETAGIAAAADERAHE